MNTDTLELNNTQKKIILQLMNDRFYENLPLVNHLMKNVRLTNRFPASEDFNRGEEYSIELPGNIIYYFTFTYDNDDNIYPSISYSIEPDNIQRPRERNPEDGRKRKRKSPFTATRKSRCKTKRKSTRKSKRKSTY